MRHSLFGSFFALACVSALLGTPAGVATASSLVAGGDHTG
jgi:hypothetical protein